MYYTYMLRCKDNSIYTGITTDVKRRMKEHKEKDIKGAKYTKRHEFLKLECVFSSENRVSASKLEYHIKRLSKKEKEDIILKHNLNEYLSEKLDCDKYTIADIDSFYEGNEGRQQ